MVLSVKEVNVFVNLNLENPLLEHVLMCIGLVVLATLVEGMFM